MCPLAARLAFSSAGTLLPIIYRAYRNVSQVKRKYRASSIFIMNHENTQSCTMVLARTNKHAWPICVVATHPRHWLTFPVALHLVFRHHRSPRVLPSQMTGHIPFSKLSCLAHSNFLFDVLVHIICGPHWIAFSSILNRQDDRICLQMTYLQQV